MILQALLIPAILLVPPAPADPATGEIRVELRSLQAYLGIYEAALAASAPADSPGEIGRDLHARLQAFLGRTDLQIQDRIDAVDVFHGYARASARQVLPGSIETGCRIRDVYSELIRHAGTIGRDSLPIEIEMLSIAGAGMDPREIEAALARLLPVLKSRKLERVDTVRLEGILRKILSEPGWPELENGEALSDTVDLLLLLDGPERDQDVAAIAAKLQEWTARILKAESAREGELAQETGIIHLFRCLEACGDSLDDARRAAAVEGLVALAPPALVGDASAAPEALRSVEIGEVRLPLRGGLRISPIPGTAPGERARYLLVPRKAYQVDLICTPVGQAPRQVFHVLARAGSESRLQIPRTILPGMVPITLAETGRVGFLCDRKPWSIRRFILAFQRCGNALGSDRAAVGRIWKHSALREIPLGEGEPTFAAVVGLLGDPAVKERLEEMFWVDVRDNASRAAAFEIASTILNGNTGLRDTGLVLPTVAEANRAIKDGAWFELVEPPAGLFSATRLIPDRPEGSDRSRHVVRTVQRLGMP